MAVFQYAARDAKGTVISGSLEGYDRQAIARTLSERGFVPLSIREAKTKSSLRQILERVRGIPSIEKVAFSRQFATMVGSGLPIAQTLHILEQQTLNPKLKTVAADLAKSVEGGNSLSSALAHHPRVFSPLYINMVRSGEVGGTLDEVLERLATQLEKEHDLIAKVRGAMIYPAFILAAMIVVTIIMLVSVIPKITELFIESDVELPLPTKILIALSDSFTQYWFITIPVILLAAYGLWYGLRKTTRGIRIRDRFILKAPVFGKLIQKMILARFTRTLGSLLASGVAVLDALSITANALNNVIYKAEVDEVAKKVKYGVLLSGQLKQSKHFPPLVGQMIAVGEETGTLDAILAKLTDFYEKDVDRIVNNLTTLLEPIIILIMGAGVAFLVMALILPVFKLSAAF